MSANFFAHTVFNTTWLCVAPHSTVWQFNDWCFLLCKLVSHCISKHMLSADVGNNNFTLGIFYYSRSFLEVWQLLMASGKALKSNNNKWRWCLWMVAADRRTHIPNRLVWSEGWRPPGAQSAFIKWTGWTLAMTMSWWQHHKHCHSYYYYYKPSKLDQAGLAFGCWWKFISRFVHAGLEVCMCSSYDLHHHR